MLVGTLLRLSLARKKRPANLATCLGRFWPAPHRLTRTFVIDRRALVNSPTESLILEDRARNTCENTLFTRDLVNPKLGERWLANDEVDPVGATPVEDLRPQ